METVLLTGGTGMIGKDSSADRKGFSVTAFTRNQNDKQNDKR
jgi:NAD dependent epimerase/dehydratase family enzyme